MRAEVVEGTTVASGAAWINAMAAWKASPVAVSLEPLRAEFEAAMKTAHGTLLASFLRAAQGFPGLPVHYPRLASQGDTDVEHFQWFMENDKEGRDETGLRLSLPDLGGSVVLPRTPTQATAQRQPRGDWRR